MSPTTSISWLYRQLHYSIFRTILQAFFDHMFDHSWIRTVWKQCSREHTKAWFSDWKVPKITQESLLYGSGHLGVVEAARSSLVTQTISSVHNQPESWMWTLDFFLSTFVPLGYVWAGILLLFFVMPVTHSEHTLLQRPFGFPHGNCFVLQDLAVPNTPQTCSESLSAACGSFRCLWPRTHQCGQ